MKTELKVDGKEFDSSESIVGTVLVFAAIAVRVVITLVDPRYKTNWNWQRKDPLPGKRFRPVDLDVHFERK